MALQCNAFLTLALMEAKRCFSFSLTRFISCRMASTCRSYTMDCRCISVFCDSMTSCSCFAALLRCSASCRFSSSTVAFCVCACFSNSYTLRHSSSTTWQRAISSCICEACAACAAFCLQLTHSTMCHSSTTRCSLDTSPAALFLASCSWAICLPSCCTRASSLLFIRRGKSHS